ncbi:MAG: hypothetical protein AB7V40_05450 [Methyloceanibacter sp.]
MPSVSVVWKGNCHDQLKRYRLLGYLHRLAVRSDEFWRRRQPERPPLKVVSAEHGKAMRPRANIELIDEEVSGTILLSSLVGPEPGRLAAAAREAGLAHIDNAEDRNAPSIALAKARLRGLDFKLFDPRGLYPAADRMSFVFLECDENPVLDGWLVERALGEDGAADLHLRAPSVHLRYYLEDWTDCLFSWIKFFFIDDLWWHRWEAMQGYADYRHVFEDLQAARGAEAAEEAAFDAVLATFSQHAEHWIGEVEGWAKAEQG